MPKGEKLKPADLLGPLEAKVMDAIWRHPDLSAAGAAEIVNEDRSDPLSTNTIVHVCKNLEAKGYLYHRVGGRAFYYTAGVPEEEFVAFVGQRELDRVLERFGDELSIPHLVRTDSVGSEVLAHLRELLARYDTSGDDKGNTG